MKSRHALNAPRARALLLLPAALLLSALYAPRAASAGAFVPRIRAVAAGSPLPDAPGLEPFAMLLETGAGSESLVVRGVDRKTGRRQGSDLRVTFPEGVTPVALCGGRDRLLYFSHE
jgi:hypothetical protein